MNFLLSIFGTVFSDTGTYTYTIIYDEKNFSDYPGFYAPAHCLYVICK